MPPEPAPDVRSRILDAALGLLAEHGFIELTQPRVAKAAGVRQSHLTYYFPTRSDLLKAVAIRSIESLLGGVAAGASAGAMTTEGFIRAAGDALADRRRARVMLGLVVSSDEDREIKQFMREFVKRVRDGVATVAGLLGLEPGPADVAAFHMLLVGAAVLNVARDDAQSRRECADVARIAVERLLAGGPRRRQPRKPGLEHQE